MLEQWNFDFKKAFIIAFIYVKKNQQTTFPLFHNPLPIIPAFHYSNCGAKGS